MDKLEIKIDATDWKDQVLRDETIVTTKDELIDIIKKGGSTSQAAISAIVSEEIGAAPLALLRSRKNQLRTGGMVDVSAIIANMKHEVETPSGAVYETRDFIGVPGANKNDEETKTHSGPDFVSSRSEDGFDRAINYLDKVVPGHIWNRLTIVFENSGDVERAAETLKHKIDEMVKKLT